MQTIELLYWEGCPSHPEALALLEAILAERGIDVPVALREVRTDAEAVELGFPGSPTIRWDAAFHAPIPAATSPVMVMISSTGSPGFRIRMEAWSCVDMIVLAICRAGAARVLIR